VTAYVASRERAETAMEQAEFNYLRKELADLKEREMGLV
jgi:hypothetical protein